MILGYVIMIESLKCSIMVKWFVFLICSVGFSLHKCFY